MNYYLIQLDAKTLAGAAQTIRLASHDNSTLCHFDAVEWRPAIQRLPTLRYDFFGGEFRNSITRPVANFSANIFGAPLVVQSRFSGARFRLWSADLVGLSKTLIFDGIIDSEPNIAGGVATFDAGPDDSWLDEPLLDTYTGASGLEGPTDLEGNVKPLILGNTRFAPGVLIDATDNVYQLSGYGDIQAVNKTYDRVASLGSSVGNYTTLANLIAATINEGQWGTCLADGLVRLGAPADGKVSFDVSGDNSGTGGYVRKPGAIIGRIAEIKGGTTDSANLAALDTARPYNLAVVVTAQTTARQLIQQIADSVGATVGMTWTGTLFVQALAYGTASGNLWSDGTSLPAVREVNELPIGAPFWRLATEAEPTWVVHTFDEIATGYAIRGAYSATRTYREDDLVFTTDGASWVYINATPSAGNAVPDWPTTSNTYWSNLSPPTAYRTTVGGSVPNAADSSVGDIHIADDGRVYERLDTNGILLDTFAVTLGGFRPIMPWSLKAMQPISDQGQTANWSQVTNDNGLLPEDSADVTKMVTGAPTITLAYDSSGAIKDDETPRSETYTLETSSGTAISNGLAWSVATASGSWSGSAPTISGTGTGVLTINSGPSAESATVTVTATASDRSYTFSVLIDKAQDAPANSGGSSGDGTLATDTAFATFTGTSFTVISDELTVTTGSSSTSVTLTAANLVLKKGVTGDETATNCEFKWQWDSTGGGSWADVSSAVASDPDPWNTDVEGKIVRFSGNVTCNDTKSSLSSSTSYKFRLVARIESGETGILIYTTGTASAQG